MTILRDCYEGLVSMAPDGTPVAGAAESWTVSADGRRYTFSLRAAARWSNGDRVVAEDFVAAWRRLVDPATASQYALMLEPVANAADIVAGRKPADGARRRGAGRGDARRRPRRAHPVFPRDALAPEHLPGASPDARREPEGVRAPRHRGDERRVHAGRMGHRLAHPRDAERALLERRGDEARRRALRARRRSHDRAHALSRRRPRRDLHGAAGRGRAARGGAAGAASHRADGRRVLLRLRARPAAVQGRREAAAGARDGGGPRAAHEAGARRRRTARLWLGAAGHRRLRAAAVRLGDARRGEAHRRGEAALCRGGLFGGEAARSGAAHQQEPAARSHRARGDRDVEGAPRRRGQPALRGLPRAEAAIDAREAPLFAAAGSATTTTPIPSSRC